MAIQKKSLTGKTTTTKAAPVEVSAVQGKTAKLSKKIDKQEPVVASMRLSKGTYAF